MIRILALASLVGCSYSKPADVGPPGDSQVSGDSGAIDGPPADAYTCNAQGTYPMTGLDTDAQIAVGIRSQTPNFDVWEGRIDPNGGELILQLSEGDEPFIGGIHTGAFPLTLGVGPGLLVGLGYEIDQNNSINDWYLATTGTMVLQQVPDASGGGTFAGEFQNVKFVRVVTTNHQPSSTPATPMCMSLVQALSFNIASTPM